MNIGIIGSGSIIDTFISAIKNVKGTNIAAICSRNKESERIKELREKYSISLAYDDIEKMLTNPNIDFVYVASPNSLHYSQSLKALKAGKNVICEKPFTSTSKEAQHLLNVAKEKQLMIFEGIAVIHLPNFQVIKDNIHRLGRLRIIQLNFSQYSRKYDLFLAGELPNVFNPEFSGGSLADINIYNVHFMTAMFGMPEKYEYFPNIHENGIDTSGVVLMQYPGFSATLTGSKDTRGNNFVYIQGEKGYIHVNSESSTCKEVVVDVNGEPPRSLNLQYYQNPLFYELEVFKGIYDSKDFNKCYELAEYSLSVVKLIESIRKKSGIVFAADNSNL